MKTVKTLLFILIAQLSFAQVVDKKAEDIVKKLAEKNRAYAAIKVEFTYSMENKTKNINEKHEGTVWIKGDFYKITLLGHTLISDGKTVWTIMQEEKEVQIRTTDNSEEESSPAKILTSYDKNYRPKLIKETQEGGKTIQIIDLTPNKTKSFFKIRLKIDKQQNQLISSTIHEKDETTFTYLIKKLDGTIRLPDNFFVFDKTKYPGFEIIDMR